MVTPSSLYARLACIEQVLRDHDLWQDNAPDDEAWQSEHPFFMDTLSPCQWLQWVLIPRLNQLLDAGHPLPERLAVTPYYEFSLPTDSPVREALLVELRHLDALFSNKAGAQNA